MADDQGEKTEKPTCEDACKDAREKGQVARSRDLGVALSSLARDAGARLVRAGACCAAARPGWPLGCRRVGDRPLTRSRPAS